MTDKKRLEEIEKALLTMSQTFRQIEANLPTTLQNLARAIEDLGYEMEATTSAIFRILIEKGIATAEEIMRAKDQCHTALDQERAQRRENVNRDSGRAAKDNTT
jgi:ABC-type transporter Mla subunit MlaD